MSGVPRAAIVSTAYAVPPHVRTNDDSIFDYIKKNDPTHGSLFFGYKERRALRHDEDIEPYMVEASRAAMAQANLAPGDIDILLGFCSISEYLTPHSLARVHADLQLSQSCWALPIHADYSNFPAALMLADSLVMSGRATNVLIACGSNWTKNVSYLTPVCVSIGDGAGAAVVSRTTDASCLRMVDYEIQLESTGYGGMFTSSDPEPDAEPHGPRGSPFNEALSHAYFHLTDKGVGEFKVFGTEAPPKVINTLLARNSIAASDATVVCYQSSAMLIDAWTKAVRPRQMLHTLEMFGNLVVATMPVNLAYLMPQIETDNVVLLSMGAEPHASATLLRRNG